MKHLFIVLLILFYCNVNLKANSNKDFIEGYIISLNGDTTKGYLLLQESRNASEKCIFRNITDGEPIIYKPGEISSYRYLNGKYYISKEITIESTTKKVVFLEFLIKGMANVYYYVDNDEHYYIEKFPNGLLELTEKQTTSNVNGRNYITPSKYKGKLMHELQDCPGISNEIQNTRLTHKSLIKLTKDYHEKVCNSESCIIYEKGNTSSKVKFGILLGFSKNMYNFGGQFITNYGNNYQIGVALKISNFLMFNEHLKLKANILFEKDSKSYTISLPDDVHFNHLTYNNVVYNLRNLTSSYDYLPSIKADVNVLDLKVPIILNYDFNIAKKTILACGIGISNKIIVSQNKNFRVDEFYAAYGESIHSLLTGVIVTTGIEGNWFGEHTVFVNMTYEYLNDFRSKVDNTLKLVNTQFSLQIGMYF
jgi:hypothetical protein